MAEEYKSKASTAKVTKFKIQSWKRIMAEESFISPPLLKVTSFLDLVKVHLIGQKEDILQMSI